MGGVVKSIAKVFGIGGSSRAPEVKVEQAAPVIDNPVQEPAEVEVGTFDTETAEKRKRKGKSSLRIDLSSSAGGSRGGLNIT